MKHSLDSNRSSVYKLTYYLILVAKYRKKVFNDDVSNRAKEIFINMASNYQITLLEWNQDLDHIHILFKSVPKTNISKFINAYKSASSRLIKQKFECVRKLLWTEAFWSRSFCLLTTGGAPLDVIKKYIESQGE